MKSKAILLLSFTIPLFLMNFIVPQHEWLTEKTAAYTLHYTSFDNDRIPEYNKLFETGISSVSTFFNAPFPDEFSIYIHPSRTSMDSTWRKDWNVPEFKSECWMVASGVASKLDLLSPACWKAEACEHNYTESIKTQQLITHELLHVYHGQLNASPDFSNVEGIDWFVEGLATYVSGQCDSLRLAEVKEAVVANKTPNQLDNFWSGKLKYGLSGSVVMYLSHKYGIVRLKELLPLTKKTEILSTLHISESELLSGWRDFILNL